MKAAAKCGQLYQFCELAGTDNSDVPIWVQGQQMVVVCDDPASPPGNRRRQELVILGIFWYVPRCVFRYN